MNIRKYFDVSDKYSSTLPQTPFARPLPESRAGSPGKFTNNQKMASSLKLINEQKMTNKKLTMTFIQ